MKKIALVRFDEQQKKAVAVTLNGKAALMGDISQNVPLQDNDVIVIGRNLVGRITQTLNVFTQPFRDVLGFLLFFRQLGDNASNLFGPNR
jgi:polysaccharide biosynthesis/export protein